MCGHILVEINFQAVPKILQYVSSICGQGQELKLFKVINLDSLYLSVGHRLSRISLQVEVVMVLFDYGTFDGEINFLLRWINIILLQGRIVDGLILRIELMMEL
jgi:hypothetical protein